MTTINSEQEYRTMLQINPNEEFNFIGEITRSAFIKRNNYFIEFKVTELNRKRIRPELILLSITKGQKLQLDGLTDGDILYVEAEGATDEERYDANAINFAFLHDYKLMHKNRNSRRDKIRDYLDNMSHGKMTIF